MQSEHEKKLQRSRYTYLRFDYYVAGRTVWLSGQMAMGGMLLGYAIETALKHLLVECGEANNRAVARGHDYLELVKMCKSAGKLHGLKASGDFLRYAQDGFHMRYPSQQRQTLQKAEADGTSLNKGIDNLPAYDDLIMQLNDAVVEKATPATCIGAKAAESFDTVSGRFFWTSNAAAMARRETICERVKSQAADAIAFVEASDDPSQEMLAQLTARAEAACDAVAGGELYRYEKAPFHIGSDCNAVTRSLPAASFRLDGSGPTYDIRLGWGLS